MKKIDLHIHTVQSISDSYFEFDFEHLSEYVINAQLDGIAITNHNLFDAMQFNEISGKLEITVFPGIEVNLAGGHILVIGERNDVESFAIVSKSVESKILSAKDSLTVSEFKNIFGNLDRYLLIPHYEKGPSIKVETLESLSEYIFVGEVDSPKKFIRTIKDKSKIAPVLFSDVRITKELNNYPARQTFVDCGELTLNSLKTALKDKTKVALSESEGNKLFQIFDDGQKLSTGLNVLLGERSSGKSFTLDRICQQTKNVKYIKQFSLVQKDEASYEKEFNENIAKERSLFCENYLIEFKTVLNQVISIDLYNNDRKVEKYIKSLIKSAEETEKKDSFSKTAIFDETFFELGDDSVLKDLIGSVRQVIENIEFRPLIEKYLDFDPLKRLACELIEVLWVRTIQREKKQVANSLIKDIKQRLKLHTSATQVEDVDLFRVKMDSELVARFCLIVKELQKDAEIWKEDVQGFKVVAKRGAFKNAREIKDTCSHRASFADAFRQYKEPYEYLLALNKSESLIPSEFYKFFSKINYEILNRDGYRVSGGERSEFRLLQEIKDAQNYDILLIDEPESSFDNIFLMKKVNKIIKEISETMPVVLVTHNNTVGASIKPDYVLYAMKDRKGTDIIYRLYSGYPADKVLVSVDGLRMTNSDVLLNSLEAGDQAYNERGKFYESIKG